MKTKIEKWYQEQKAGKQLPCPRCGGKMDSHLANNAFSRRAEIYVCDFCGMIEAIEDHNHARNPVFPKLSLDRWYMFRLNK